MAATRRESRMIDPHSLNGRLLPVAIEAFLLLLGLSHRPTRIGRCPSTELFTSTSESSLPTSTKHLLHWSWSYGVRASRHAAPARTAEREWLASSRSSLTSRPMQVGPV